MMKRFVLALTLAALAVGPAVAENHGKGCCTGMEGVTKQVTNLDNGVKVTLSAKDPKTVAKLQEHLTGEHGTSCGKDCPMHLEGVTRNVEKTADGVVITATATDAAVVKRLQEHAAKAEKACSHHGEGAEHGTTASNVKGCPMGDEHHGETAAAGTPAKKSCPLAEGAKSCAKPTATK